MQTLETISTAPYPYRDQTALRTGLNLSEQEAADFSLAGCLRVIERLEATPGAWAKSALNRERRAFMILHGAVEPYSPAELNCPARQDSEIMLELRAARRFHHEFN